MRAYKGFNENLKCTCGKGIFTYEPGRTYTEEQSKTASTGFHCAEYLPDCFKFYQVNGKNRFYQVEAGGSIDEEQFDTKIACTELTLVRELTLKQMAIACMLYMVAHPLRHWEVSCGGCMIAKEQAAGRTGIVIARGSRPKVKGEKGCAIGLVLEKKGNILQAQAAEIDGKHIKPDTWYSISKEGKIYAIQED